MAICNDTKTLWKSCHRHYLDDEHTSSGSRPDGGPTPDDDGGPGRADTYDNLPQAPADDAAPHTATGASPPKRRDPPSSDPRPSTDDT